MADYTLTKEGYEKLKEEYKYLSEVERPNVLKQMSDARELGDLRENGAYHAARHRLSIVQGRLEELKNVLDNVEIVESTSDDGIIGIGSTVTVFTAGIEREFIIVGEQEADLATGRISSESPIGQALVGSREGEKISFNAPKGVVEYTIVTVK
ncbi:transcription elongation factor GreA [candidate division WWE3 bacterium]|uniref:Transcription elongation factor GreA n=1 Tax=candidate division WWE3 bacterium TaxID=2053526 RepID=A0A955LJX1_UNCKA|nr:transcription elongation factor GreA [candidate division WWE3 bacterium]